MDEIKVKVKVKPVPRYRLYLSNAKDRPIGEAVCASDNLDDLRMFPRKAGTRYVLYEWRNQRPLNNLDVDSFTDIRSATDKSRGGGWYCKNPKCGMLISATGALPANETLLRIICPHCHHADYYFYRDFLSKKWRACASGQHCSHE